MEVPVWMGCRGLRGLGAPKSSGKDGWSLCVIVRPNLGHHTFLASSQSERVGIQQPRVDSQGSPGQGWVDSALLGAGELQICETFLHEKLVLVEPRMLVPDS